MCQSVKVSNIFRDPHTLAICGIDDPSFWGTQFWQTPKSSNFIPSDPPSIWDDWLWWSLNSASHYFVPGIAALKLAFSQAGWINNSRVKWAAVTEAYWGLIRWHIWNHIWPLLKESLTEWSRKSSWISKPAWKFLAICTQRFTPNNHPAIGFRLLVKKYQAP
jgi:hypothetical protein